MGRFVWYGIRNGEWKEIWNFQCQKSTMFNLVKYGRKNTGKTLTIFSGSQIGYLEVLDIDGRKYKMECNLNGRGY